MHLLILFSLLLAPSAVADFACSGTTNIPLCGFPVDLKVNGKDDGFLGKVLIPSLQLLAHKIKVSNQRG